MQQQQLLDKVIALIRDHLNLQDMDITGETQLVFDLGLTSVDLLDMCGALENELGVVVNEDKIVRMETVSDIVHCLEEHP
ncbi:MAG: acyl carrier protein [Peptococcaceae bacterium]|nr:acyl carrier protein [Peptococcaceae bacterium]